MITSVEINENDRKQIARGLNILLADTYCLYLKTYNFHRNVAGPMVQTLYIVFERQYTELALAIDHVAKRIRSLGFPVPKTYRELMQLSSIKETIGVPKAEEMIRLLVEGQEIVARTAQSIFLMVENATDEGTADLLIHRIKMNEDSAFALRKLLKK